MACQNLALRRRGSSSSRPTSVSEDDRLVVLTVQVVLQHLPGLKRPTIGAAVPLKFCLCWICRCCLSERERGIGGGGGGDDCFI